MNGLQYFLISFVFFSQVFLSIDFVLVSGQCLEDQRLLLVQLRDTLEFDPSLATTLKSWDQKNDCCIWKGVNCNSVGQVIGLDLSNESISGGFNDSSVLFGLENLQRLNLAQNQFHSIPIPSRLGNLTSLVYLNLSFSDFSGQIPWQLSQLTGLKILDLSSDGAYGIRLEKPSLATLVQNLTQLTGLYLDYVNISAQKSDWGQVLSSSLINLEALSLQNCYLLGPINESLEKMQSLSRIDLSRNNLNTHVPDFIANFRNLTVLKLRACNLKGPFPKKVLRLPSLEILDLSVNSDLSGSLPESVGDLRMLSRLELYNCSFSGLIPQSMGNLSQLYYLDLSTNNFNGQIPSFQNCKKLTYIKLSGNSLSGQIPKSFFELRRLTFLSLASNKLNGTILTDDFEGISNLTSLDLSYNNLSIQTSGNESSMSHFPQFSNLYLASCNLQRFPDLRNQSRLTFLDLSSNKIGGEIPSWVWSVGSRKLQLLNLARNQLTGFQKPFVFPGLFYLDVHSNQLSGVIPVPPQDVLEYVDYSDNLFSSVPETIGNSLRFSLFFSVSKNSLTGTIPRTLCNARFLKVLDLSNNGFSGGIPQCLIQIGPIFGVMNLANNNLSGPIMGTFPSRCSIETLDLHGNSFEGKIPPSLANCSALEVLNLRNNRINDVYPCFLRNNTNLRVLVLRSNRLHGNADCGPDPSNAWQKLQILDIAFNNLSGAIPGNWFWNWHAMMNDKDGAQSNVTHLRFLVSDVYELYYEDSVTVIVKRLELELVKILNVFTTIDISNNHFGGEIPSAIGRLKALHLLNVSHNEINGSIPQSIGDLNQIESLDLAVNKITGQIPSVLAGLPFLSVLDLSYNQLEGRVPTGPQLQTFTNDSYQGNTGLCGYPLTKSCKGSGETATPPPPVMDSHHHSLNNEDFISIEVGFVVGLLIIILPLIFSGRWNRWYYKHVDRIFFTRLNRYYERRDRMWRADRHLIRGP